MRNFSSIRVRFFRVHAIAISLLAILAASPAAWAATYYVNGSSSVANDSNPGTELQPWKTIQRAANVAVAGDTVLVKAGTYYEAVSITRSGTAGARITFKAYPGSRPIIDGTGKVPSWKGVVYSGSSTAGTRYVTLDGFEIRNSVYYGIRVNASSNWEIRNCRIHGADAGGILLNRTNSVLMTGNHVYETGWNGISIMGGGNNVIEYNRSYNNVDHAGVNIITDHPTGDAAFYDNNVVRYNYIYYNHTGIYTRNQRYMKIYENVIYDNDRNGGYAGIYMHEGDGTSASFVSNSSIYNNTIAGHPVAIANSSHRYVTTKNNIFYFQATDPLRLNELDQSVDYNLCYGMDDPAKGVHGMYRDPKFVNPGAKDFRVMSDSPVLGSGEGGKNIGAVPPPGTAPVEPSPAPAKTLPPPRNLRI